MKNKNKSMYYDNKEKEGIEVSLNKGNTMRIEGIVVADITNPNEFIRTINNIYLNPTGKDVEIKGVNLEKTKILAKGYLDLNFTLPITMQIRKLRKTMSPKQGNNKHLHGLTS